MLSIATLSPIYAKLREPVPIITPITVARTLFFTPLVTNIKMAEIAMQSSHLSSSVTSSAQTLGDQDYFETIETIAFGLWLVWYRL